MVSTDPGVNMDDHGAVYKTVIAVLPTPFRDDGSLDDEGLRRLIRYVMAGGVTVLTINGNTGEFSSLSADEQSRVSDVAIASADGGATIVAGVGGDLATAMSSSRRAAAAGASAVMVHDPSGPFRSAAGWSQYYERIAEVVPDTAVIPYIRDARVDAATLDRLVDRCSNVVAVKYAVPDPIRFGGLVDDLGTDRVAWICGLAELWAPFFWVARARGFTSGLAAIAPTVALKMLEQLRAWDEPGINATWNAVRGLEELRARHNGAANVPVIKEAMHQLGLGGRTVRPPISELGEADRGEVSRIIASWPIGIAGEGAA
jgi:4-hydroxy-tetrahydrodipicolinate synthase